MYFYSLVYLLMICTIRWITAFIVSANSGIAIHAFIAQLSLKVNKSLVLYIFLLYHDYFSFWIAQYQKFLVDNSRNSPSIIIHSSWGFNVGFRLPESPFLSFCWKYTCQRTFHSEGLNKGCFYRINYLVWCYNLFRLSNLEFDSNIHHEHIFQKLFLLFLLHSHWLYIYEFQGQHHSREEEPPKCLQS